MKSGDFAAEALPKGPFRTLPSGAAMLPNRAGDGIQVLGPAASFRLTTGQHNSVFGFKDFADIRAGDDVEAALVEAWGLWRRSPGGGRWPFASDGPWHLVQRETRAGDYDARGGDGEAPPPREPGLSVAEVAARDRATVLLAMVPERDRRLVCIVIEQLGRGAARPDWGLVLVKMGMARGKEGLRKRYRRALEDVARRVRGGAHG
jgi:hypothetical protein